MAATESSHLDPQAGSGEFELQTVPPVNGCCHCVGLVQAMVVFSWAQLPRHTLSHSKHPGSLVVTIIPPPFHDVTRCKRRRVGLSVGVGDPMLSCSLHFDPFGFLPWSPSAVKKKKAASVVMPEGYMHHGQSGCSGCTEKLYCLRKVAVGGFLLGPWSPSASAMSLSKLLRKCLVTIRWLHYQPIL